MTADQPSRKRKMTGIVLGVLATLLAGGIALGACFGAPGYQGPAGATFNGETFVNQIPQPTKGMTDYLSMRMDEEQPDWPEWIDSEPGPKPPARVGEGELRVTFVGHSTVLLQMDGVNILTDPVWSDTIGPVSWAGRDRVRAPGLAFEELPPIDAVVISHNHYDHLDIPTLQRLHERFEPTIYAGLGTRALLEEHDIPASDDMDWWERRQVPGSAVQITSVPAQHWSGRGLGDQKNTLWMGFVMEGPAGQVYFAGDTGWGPQFEQVAEKFTNIRLALLPIGAYKPEWFMAPNHISPSQAVEAHKVLGARRSVPIHYGTFQLGLEAIEEPLADLAIAMGAQSVTGADFRVLEFGIAWAMGEEGGDPAAGLP